MRLTTIRNTILTGAILLIPVGAIAYFAAIIFVTARDLAKPIIDLFGIESFLGFLILNLVALACVVLVCFLAGLAARMAFVSDRVQRLDETLSRIVPGYSLIVGTLRGTVSADTAVDTMRPVLVRVGNMLRLGFEIEQAPNDHIVVFLPGVPNAQSGIAAAVPADEVRHVNLPPHKVVEMLQFYGKGLSSLVVEHLDEEEVTSA